MRVSEMYESKWLRSADLGDEDATVTIKRLREEEVGTDKEGKEESKLVAYFAEWDKPLVLNKTNTLTLAAILGDETDDWINKRVTLFVTEVQFGKEMVPAIRIRKKLPRPAAKPATGNAAKLVAERELGTRVHNAREAARDVNARIENDRAAGLKSPNKPMTQAEVDQLDPDDDDAQAFNDQF